MRRFVITALAVLGPALVGCASSPAPGEPIDSGATLDAPAFAESVTQPNTVVVDVRTPPEFASGHLAGARNIDVNGDFAAGIASLDKQASYAIYCRSGNRSATAMQIMQDAGFGHVFHLGGGIGAWQQAGLEVVR